MKAILALCAATLIGGGWLIYSRTRLPNKFGDFTGAPKAEVADLVANPRRYLRQTVAVDGIVRNQCTTMGCYFFFIEGQNTLRIDLEHVAMTAPKGKNGRHARAEGQMEPYGDGYELMATAVEFE